MKKNIAISITILTTISIDGMHALIDLLKRLEPKIDRCLMEPTNSEPLCAAIIEGNLAYVQEILCHDVTQPVLNESLATAILHLPTAAELPLLVEQRDTKKQNSWFNWNLEPIEDQLKAEVKLREKIIYLLENAGAHKPAALKLASQKGIHPKRIDAYIENHLPKKTIALIE